MGRIVNYEILEISYPDDVDVDKGKLPLFKEESPPDPVSALHFWLSWANMAGGSTDSYSHLIAEIYSRPFGINVVSTLFFSRVDDQLGGLYSQWQLFAGAAPSDGGELVRVGNKNMTSGQLMDIAGEYFRIRATNTGTAYTGGKLTVAPVGYISP